MMKAAIVEGNGTLCVRDVPAPEVSDDYAILCDVAYGSMCAGTDSHLVKGEKPFCDWISTPFILGHESVGRAVTLGAKVRHVRVGDLITRVMCPAVGDVNSGWGGFCEQALAYDYQAMIEDGVADTVQADRNNVLPPEVDAADATLFITWRETFSYTKRMGVCDASSVLILGSGGNGYAFVSHARNLGATTIAMIGSAAREADAMKAGCTHYINYKSDDVKGEGDAICPDGFDFVIDVLGTLTCSNLGLSLLADGGTFGSYGFDSGAMDVSMDESLARGAFTVKDKSYLESEAHDDVLQFYLDGKLDPSVWLDKTKVFSLDEIQAAYDAVQDRSLVKPLVKIKG
jgi:D-arabinose 1-dehydrogenase-like Zn-dependent alcohol dehydrogenase